MAMVMTTTERGYGWPHQRQRAKLLSELVPGTPCALCGKPMNSDHRLDLDHSDPEARLAGKPGDRLTHEGCNRRESAQRNAKARNPNYVPNPECAVCGKPFERNHNVRTCSRACGWTLRRTRAPASNI